MSTIAHSELSSLNQADRLGRTEKLRAHVALLERQIRELQREMALLLQDCEHTDVGGRSALTGSRTKVCSHCGRVVAGHFEKLWG